MKTMDAGLGSGFEAAQTHNARTDDLARDVHDRLARALVRLGVDEAAAGARVGPVLVAAVERVQPVEVRHDLLLARVLRQAPHRDGVVLGADDRGGVVLRVMDGAVLPDEQQPRRDEKQAAQRVAGRDQVGRVVGLDVHGGAPAQQLDDRLGAGHVGREDGVDEVAVAPARRLRVHARVRDHVPRGHEGPRGGVADGVGLQHAARPCDDEVRHVQDAGEEAEERDGAHVVQIEADAGAEKKQVIRVRAPER